MGLQFRKGAITKIVNQCFSNLYTNAYKIYNLLVFIQKQFFIYYL